MAEPQRHWYNDRELFLHGLARSNYVTAITDWFMSFAGKWAELVLYGTVLYSCAELYPGVHLPAGLSLAVFLVQLGALDIGGLSLGKLAKQARQEGNVAGAGQAATLSKWLIGIMLVGVVTVGLEHALPVALPDVVTVSIDVVLVVARSICAVLYGRVVHDLKQDITIHQANELSQQVKNELSTGFDLLRQELSNQLSATLELTRQELRSQASELSQGLNTQGSQLATIQEAIAVHEQAITRLNALSDVVERLDRTARQLLTDGLAPKESSAKSRPQLSLVSTEKLSGKTGQVRSKDFIESYLTQHPQARNAEIIQEATKLGLTLTQSYVSQIRKALKEQSA